VIEIEPNFFVGNQIDEQKVRGKEGWAVVHACKEPYHREALGYSGQGAPKDHKEYLIARRGDRLCLNLVDVSDPQYVRKEIIDAAIAFIREQLDAGKNVLVHCNQGHSRGPTIGMLWAAPHLPFSFEQAVEAFRERYPDYQPAGGMLGFAIEHWPTYWNMTERAKSLTPA